MIYCDVDRDTCHILVRPTIVIHVDMSGSMVLKHLHSREQADRNDNGRREQTTGIEQEVDMAASGQIDHRKLYKCYELHNCDAFMSKPAIQTAQHIGRDTIMLNKSDSLGILHSDQKPFIPGSSLKGVLRSMIEKNGPSSRVPTFDAVHLITVDGIEGVGKTALVLEVAYHCLKYSTGEVPSLPKSTSHVPIELSNEEQKGLMDTQCISPVIQQGYLARQRRNTLESADEIQKKLLDAFSQANVNHLYMPGEEGNSMTQNEEGFKEIQMNIVFSLIGGTGSNMLADVAATMHQIFTRDEYKWSSALITRRLNKLHSSSFINTLSNKVLEGYDLFVMDRFDMLHKIGINQMLCEDKLTTRGFQRTEVFNEKKFEVKRYREKARHRLRALDQQLPGLSKPVSIPA